MKDWRKNKDRSLHRKRVNEIELLLDQTEIDHFKTQHNENAISSCKTSPNSLFKSPRKKSIISNHNDSESNLIKSKFDTYYEILQKAYSTFCLNEETKEVFERIFSAFHKQIISLDETYSK